MVQQSTTVAKIICQRRRLAHIDEMPISTRLRNILADHDCFYGVEAAIWLKPYCIGKGKETHAELREAFAAMGLELGVVVTNLPKDRTEFRAKIEAERAQRNMPPPPKRKPTGGWATPRARREQFAEASPA